MYDGRTGTMLASSQADVAPPGRQPDEAAHRPDRLRRRRSRRRSSSPRPGCSIDADESRIGITEGQELPRDLLIRAMLIVSANDAARLLALDIAGGEAAVRRADEPAGRQPRPDQHPRRQRHRPRPDGQYSSADDMTRLAAFLMDNPTFQLTVERTDATLNGQRYPASNDLLDEVPRRRRR